MTPETILNLVLFVPVVGAIALAFLPKEQHGVIRGTALGVAVLNLLLSIALLTSFDVAKNEMHQFLTQVVWIKQFNVQYKVGVDGISLVLVLLTTLLSAIAILASFTAITDRVKEYYVFLLLLETGMIGVFASLDLILFYVFWEAMLIPMYFLIGIWGGPRKLYATIKFVLYTLVGSLLMLVAIIWVYVKASQAGAPTFDVNVLTGPGSPLSSTLLGSGERFWLFLAFASAFAIKVPMWPFHTWLPDAHVEAPTAGSVILAGVLLKMGTYGFLRFCIPMFPDIAVQTAPWFLALAVIGIIYGALVAFVQQDIKRLVAYSSVSHLGFCVLGLFAFTREGVTGSILQMINHGLSTGALFLIVGMIYERRHTREISQFGGLWKVIPVFGAFFLITTLSSIGLPGLNGFIGEFLILMGTFGVPGQKSISMWAAILASTGVILGAVYMLWMFQRVMQGPLDNPENKKLKDLGPREVIVLLPLIIGMFWLGVRPGHVTQYFDNAAYATIIRPIQDYRTASGQDTAAPAVLSPAAHTEGEGAGHAPAGAGHAPEGASQAPQGAGQAPEAPGAH